jgi:integrase
MPDVNFYLQKPKAPKPKTKDSKTKDSKDKKPRKEHLVYLQMKYGGERLVYSFGQFIEPGDWNKNKQRAKSKNSTTADGKYYINDLLDSLEDVCIQAYNDLIRNGTPAPESIRARLQAFMNQDRTKQQESKTGLLSLIHRFVDNEISYRGRQRQGNTTRTYKTTLNHLKEFAKKNKTVLDYDHVTLDFYNSYVTYLRKQGLNVNSIGRDIKNIKTFMNEAVDMGYTTNLQFKHKKFAVGREDTEAVYLTWDEIMKLYRYDFSANKRLERVRDLFVFGCCVGLRYSDFSRIRPENIIKDGTDYFIKVNTRKTGEMVIIPCNPVVLEIFSKYKSENNTLPRAVSSQKFNDYIKDCCELAGLNEAGRLTTKPDLPLYKCVSSHTARRSMATNYYLEGFPVIDLTRITGHKTESSFLRYIKLSKLDAARRLQVHINKNWNAVLMRVAS